jgi:hypothetical protein
LLHPVRLADPEAQRGIEQLRREVERHLMQLTESLDTLKGLRGAPEFLAPVNMRGNAIRGVGRPEREDDAQQAGWSLGKNGAGTAFDARGVTIENMPDARTGGQSVPLQQLEARLRRQLENAVFTGIVTIPTLIVTIEFRHTGATFGVFSTTPAPQQSAIADLTDNTGATADNVIENVPASTGDAGGIAMVSAAANVATVASVNTALTALENNIADLAAKVDALTAMARTFGLIAI